MRERISMKSKMLGALALFTLIGALFVMQSADQYTPTADAATGSIDALNVGTCLTTDAKLFKGEDCDLSGDGSGTNPVKWEVREKVAEVSTLYATYAHDPRTQSEAPRAILADSDLIKISIADPDRDKRSGVLIRGASYSGVNDDDDTDDTVGVFDEEAAGSLANVIQKNLAKDDLDYDTAADGDTNDTTEDIVFTSDEHLGGNNTDGIEVYRGVGADTSGSVIADSGNFTLNFTRIECDGADTSQPCTDTGSKEWQFAPGDFDVDNGAIVRFYGCVSLDATCANDDPDNDTTTPVTDPIEPLDELTVDEDRSNGEAAGDIAPWLGVNASVPTGKDVIILAIYYRTSDQENLVGGTMRCDVKLVNGACPDNDTITANGNGNLNESVTDVVYTKDEIDDNDPLLVSARADGDLEERHVDLFLTETARFSGVYQGYLRLTDANGDGQDANATPADTTVTDWGREVKDGAGNSIPGAAVLAVESGPVTIEYRDSGGTKRPLRIEIDNVPPTISVTSPANGSSSGDQTPDFAGSIEDADSGLADKSFRLVVDNKVDKKDGVEGKNDGYALDGRAPTADEVGTTKGNVTSISDYSGYATDTDHFGIVSLANDNHLYDLGDDGCSDDQDICHIVAEDYDDGASRGTFDDSLRLDLYETANEPLDIREKEFQIDFQAFVMDMAGNIGFSDSDGSNPTYINDLGEKKDRKKPNVLGYYSAHIVTLDEKDPVVNTDQSATGFYGINADDKMIADRSGVMVVFDGPIAPASVSTSTFTVELDDKSMASVIDVDVDKQYVFLKLASELASDATPEIDIAAGQKVEDMAGNETFGKELDAFDANDGISPVLTVTLSGGSGKGTGDEGPSELTKDQMKIHVSSDEPLQGAPKIVVLCNSLRWNEGENADIKKDIDDFIANRSGASDREPSDNFTRTPEVTTGNTKNEAYDYTCGYQTKVGNDNVVQEFKWSSAPGLSRAGENWDYTWKKPSGVPGVDDTALKDGALTAVVFARDRSRYDMGGETVQNWGSASTGFKLDTEVPDPTKSPNGVQPADGGKSKESRPFVLIDFTETSENTTVTLDSVELDDVEIATDFEQPETNRFVYWPASISQGKHEVEVEASDAAGNEVTFDFSFTVEARGDFMINLLAGWNAVSVPADPVDTTIGAVFTDPAVTTVIGWDTQGWRIAVRRDGVWESNDQYGALNEIRAKYGYWVKSDGFIRQPVALTTNDRGVGGPRTPLSIDTKPGWNFVGVIDQDGDQTEDHFGTSLLGSDNAPISAGEYLGSKYIRAYTWDATFSNFEVLRPDNTMMIGDGVWVYYEGGIAP